MAINIIHINHFNKVIIKLLVINEKKTDAKTITPITIIT